MRDKRLFRSIYHWILIIMMAPAIAHTQVGEVFLNQGTLRGNPIFLEEQRLLVELNDEVSFWDIDRNILLKRYDAGNQFINGISMDRRQFFLAISNGGNYLLTKDADSVYLYHTSTQTRRALAHPFPVDLTTTIQAWFTTDEKRLVLFYDILLSQRSIRIFETPTLREFDTRTIGQKLGKKLGLQAGIRKNTLYLLSKPDQVFRISLDDKPLMDSFWIPQPKESLISWNDLLINTHTGDIILKGSGKNENGVIGLLDPHTGETRKRFEFDFPLRNAWYPDWRNGRLILSGDTYDDRSFRSGYSYACIDLSRDSAWEGSFSDLSKSMLSGTVEWLHRDGHFIIRCVDERKARGVNLINRRYFPIPAEVKLNWLSMTDSMILYRSLTDKSSGKYTLLNTLTGKEKKEALPYEYLHLNFLSKLKSPYILRQYSDRRFDLCRLDSAMDSRPYKRLVLLPDTLALYPSGRMGNEYYFRLGKPPVVLDDHLEFDENFLGGMQMMQAASNTTTYYKHGVTTAQNQFLSGNAGIEDRLKNGSGFFYGKMRISEYGFQELDSLFLIDRTNGRSLAVADKDRADELFSYGAGSIASYASQIRLNGGKDRVIFRLNNMLCLLSIAGDRFTGRSEFDISKSIGRGRWVGVVEAGFCNQDRNIFITYTRNDSLHLEILDTAFLVSVSHFSVKNSGATILAASSSPQFIVSDKKAKKVLLYGFGSDRPISVYSWKNKDWMGNDMLVLFSGSGERFVLAEQEGEVGVYETRSGKRLNQLRMPDPNFRVIAMPDSEVLYFLASNGLPHAWNIRESRARSFIVEGASPATIDEVYLDKGDSLLISTSGSSIYWWHIGKRRLLRKTLLADTAGVFLGSDSGYYSVNKSLFNEVLYRDAGGSLVSPIQQFDVLYNRPSYFIQPTSNAMQVYRTALEKAYQKRIRSQGVSARAGATSFQCEVLNKRDLSTYLDTDTVVVRVGFRGAEPGPIWLHVRVNGVPIYGARGIRMSPGVTDTILIIRLIDRENSLLVYGTDAVGHSSNYFPMELVSSKDPSAGKIRFLGIGIDRFADDQFDLKYSCKDIRDLAGKLKEKFGNRIRIDTFFNEQVTVETIRKIKSDLMGCGVADRVIISYSGHGLLGRDYDYFLSTYEVDFNDPQKGGIPYAELESVLDGIPARRKMLLIDACHSGEIDKEEELVISQRSDSMGLVKGFVKDTDSTAKPKVGLQNSFELMRELFVNVGTGTGALVISAAAGNQFALERGDLKNGVFTFSILEALDKFRTMGAGELRAYVCRRVQELTKGLQQPTVRNETQAKDWSVW